MNNTIPNSQNSDDIIKRNSFYDARLKGSKEAIQAGQSYGSIPKVLSINLLNYIDGRFHPEEYHTRLIHVDANHRDLVFDHSENHFLELPKFRNLPAKDPNNPLHRWLLYFDSQTEPRLKEEIIAMDTSIQLAESAVQRVCNTPEELELYRLREKYELDRISSEIYLREQGREQGENLQTEAFRLMKKHTPPEEIKLTLNLTDEKLASYQQSFDELFNT